MSVCTDNVSVCTDKANDGMNELKDCIMLLRDYEENRGSEK